MRARFVACLVLIIFALGLACFAQSPAGTISGIVLDPAGRVIPDADILVANDLTRVQYPGKTNHDGIYIVPGLPPGPYRIQVSKPGFKTLIKPDIILNVQDAIAINFTLPVGAVVEIVTVEGGAPLINTESAVVSTVIDRQFAENLPMNGRSFQTLIYLTPGVVATASNSGDNGQFSVNGQRAASNYWMVDGVSANFGVGATQIGGGNGLGGALGSFSALGGTNSLVSVDALQEFRIATSTFAPEFGRTPGGQISIVTRSGTNPFHGTGFDYLRNSVFDAANWFNGYLNKPPLPKAEERQNDFGGTFSGPILKDRTFFFFSYEGLRLRLPQTALTTVPDLMARQNATPAMQAYLNAFPQPNGADDLATGIAQFNSSYSDPATLDAYSLRVDHKLNDGWNLCGRYNYSPSELQSRGAGGTSALSVVGTARIRTQTETVGATWAISPVLTNDLRFNYSRADSKNDAALDSFGGAVPLAVLPFPPTINSQNGLLSLSIFSLTSGFNLETGPESHVRQRQLNLVDGLSLQRGAHTLKFGVDYRILSPVLTPRKYQQVALFNDVPSAMNGEVSSGNVFSFAKATILFQNLGAYAQDTWRVTTRLTATYGLRWDIDYAPLSLSGPSIPAVTGFNLTDFSKLGFAPAGTAPYKTGYGNVAPRVGLAYQISQAKNRETVVRGGFGVFYDLIDSETGNLLATAAPPFGISTFFSNTTFPYSPEQIATMPIPPVGTLSDFSVFDPHVKLPYTLEWNVSLEQALGEAQTLSASYLGATGRRLLQTTAVIDPPTNPNISFGSSTGNTAASNYNTLQLQFRRRLSSGLEALASYTWSHSIDNASAGSAFVGSNSGVPGRATDNRGNSDFDIRHSFTLGMTYDIPSPRGDRLMRALLRGWSTDSFVLARSAPPVDLSDVNFFELEENVSANVRPDVVPGQPFYLHGSQYPGGRALNPNGFIAPPTDPVTGNPTRQGDLPRNKLRAFNAAQWDLAIHREFPIGERVRLQFRSEMFNVLNHPNFGPPSNQFGAGGFGVSTQLLGQSLSNNNLGGGGFDPLYQIGGPRSIQLALKLMF